MLRISVITSIYLGEHFPFLDYTLANIGNINMEYCTKIWGVDIFAILSQYWQEIFRHFGFIANNCNVKLIFL